MGLRLVRMMAIMRPIQEAEHERHGERSDFRATIIGRLQGWRSGEGCCHPGRTICELQHAELWIGAAVERVPRLDACRQLGPPRGRAIIVPLQMPRYDFSDLSDYDFEVLVRDLLQEELNVRLTTFSPGRDRGIDIRLLSNGNQLNLVVQCKKWDPANWSGLLRFLVTDEFFESEGF